MLTWRSCEVIQRVPINFVQAYCTPYTMPFTHRTQLDPQRTRVEGQEPFIPNHACGRMQSPPVGRQSALDSILHCRAASMVRDMDTYVYYRMKCSQKHRRYAQSRQQPPARPPTLEPRLDDVQRLESQDGRRARSATRDRRVPGIREYKDGEMQDMTLLCGSVARCRGTDSRTKPAGSGSRSSSQTARSFTC